ADVVGRFKMKNPARCLAWAPEAALLAVGAGQRVLAFHATHDGFKGSPREMSADAPHVFALAFSPDGKLLASQDAQGLKIWDVQSGRLTAALHEDMETLSKRYPASGIAFHPKSPLLASVTSSGEAFRIQDLSTLV